MVIFAKKHLVLIAILCIGIFFRLYNLSSVPPSPSLDEVSIGYNAFSILKTGVDEYGNKFPILLRAYDDFRPALYVYLVIPFIIFFDLTILAVRLPSALLSISTLVGVYFLVKELFPKITIHKKIVDGEILSLLVTLLLAISPWHIYISRLGHEVNAGFSFFIFGLLFLLRKNIYAAAVFILLSFISYQTEKIFIPIICISVGIIYFKELLPEWKKIVLAIIVGGIILVPFVQQSLSDEGLTRFRGTSIILANHERFQKSAEDVLQATNDNNLFEQVINNRRIVTAQIVFEAYISHFNPKWLFTNMGKEPHKIPGMGLLFGWELPFLLIGLIAFFVINIDKKTKLFIATWILIAPLSSSITTDAPHAMRSLVFLPTFQIFSAIGILVVYYFFNNPITRKATMVAFVGVMFISLLVLFRNYFYTFPKTQSASFQYALHDSIFYVLQNETKYDRVVFSNNDNLYQSYMFFLFDSKYDPSLYQNQGGTGSGGYAQTHSFGKYEFRPIDGLTKGKKTLYIGNVYELQNKGKILESFKNLDGKTVIIAVENEI